MKVTREVMRESVAFVSAGLDHCQEHGQVPVAILCLDPEQPRDISACSLFWDTDPQTRTGMALLLFDLGRMLLGQHAAECPLQAAAEHALAEALKREQEIGKATSSPF